MFELWPPMQNLREELSRKKKQMQKPQIRSDLERGGEGERHRDRETQRKEAKHGAGWQREVGPWRLRKEFSLLPLHHLVLLVIRQGTYGFSEQFKCKENSLVHCLKNRS